MRLERKNGDEVIDLRLECGAQVLLVPSRANRIVALNVFLPLPGAIERPEEAGLVGIMLRSLLRGTRRRNADEVALAIEQLGSSIAFEVFQDFSLGSFVCTDDAFESTMRLFFEILQEPSFEPAEFEKERQTTLAAIREAADDKLNVALKSLLRVLYNSHPYGTSRLGEIETVTEFRAEQAASLHAEFIDPAQALYVFVGNFDPEQAKHLLSTLIRPTGIRLSRPTVEPAYYVKGKTLRIERAFEQACLAVGFPACTVRDDDYFAVRVLNGVLGEGMSSRLFVSLREQAGLAYATGSTFSALIQGGHLFGYIGTKPETLSAARERMLVEFERVKQHPVESQELERAKSYIIGKNLIDHQKNAKRAFYLGYWECVGRGSMMDELFPERIRTVTSEEVLEAAVRYLDTPCIVEVGPIEKKKSGQY